MNFSYQGYELGEEKSSFQLIWEICEAQWLPSSALMFSSLDSISFLQYFILKVVFIQVFLGMSIIISYYIPQSREDIKIANIR